MCCFGLLFRLQVALDAPHIVHGGGTDRSTGYPESASKWQFTSRERVFDIAQGGFVGGVYVATFFRYHLAATLSFRRMRFGLAKTHMAALGIFAG